MTSSENDQIRDALRALAVNRHDDEAWQILVTLTFPIALATANRILHGALDLAKDAAWDAFTRIARYADLEILALTAPEGFLRYLKQVTRRASYDMARRLAMHAPEVQSGLMVPDSDLPSSMPTPEETLAATELSVEIAGLLSRDEQRLLALLLQGLTLHEIADELGISYGAAGVRLFRMREKIRRHLRRPGV